eukprot:3940871-Pleurochrysis_carterae.AAC.2
MSMSRGLVGSSAFTRDINGDEEWRFAFERGNSQEGGQCESLSRLILAVDASSAGEEQALRKPRSESASY